MLSYRTHITHLQQVATQYPESPAFQIPQYDPTTQEILRWHPISYRRFFADVELFAQYWSQKFTSDGILPRSVIGVWSV
jgi:hypothetical protein